MGIGTDLFTAKCLDCGKEWVTEWPERTRRKECPECKSLNTEKHSTNVSEMPKRVYEKDAAKYLEKEIAALLEESEYRLNTYVKLGILEAVKLGVLLSKND